MNEQMKKFGSMGSPIRAMWARATKEKEEIGEDNVFDFTLGNPSVPSPKSMDETLIELLSRENTLPVHEYTQSKGAPYARKAVAEFLNKKYQANVSPDRIVITSGAAPGLAIGLSAVLNPGEEVLTFQPYYSEYNPIVFKAGGVLKPVKTDESFMPVEDYLREAIGPKTRVLLIDSPNNPTGMFYDETVISMLVRVLREKSEEFGQPIYLFSDEPYRELLYVDKPYPFITKYYEYSIVSYSFSKSLSIPGETIGYLLTGENNPEKEDLYRAFIGVARSTGYVCASSLFQRALPKIIDKTSDLKVYERNRKLIIDGLRNIGYEFAVPEGAFYIFVKALEEDSLAFAEVAVKHHIYFVPSDYFGVKGYVRIAYCVNEKTIVDSMPKFKELFDFYRK